MDHQPAMPEDRDTAMRRPRRIFPRVSFLAHAAVSPILDGDAIEAHTFDISLGSVGLTAATPITVGQDVSLTFRFTTHAGSMATEGPVLGRVTRLRLDDDVAIIGVEFARPLSRRRTPALVRAIANSSRSPKPADPDRSG